MELNTLDTAVVAAIPTAFALTPVEASVIETASTRQAVLNGEAPPAPPLDPAARIAAMEAEIEDLKSRMEGKSNRTHPVELANGETVSVKAASLKLEDMSVDTQLEVLKSQRYIAALADAAAANTPVAAQRPLLDKDAAIKLLGRAVWEGVPNATKAAILDIRQADVDKLKPEEYFGSKSSSWAAHNLGRSNIALYRLLRLEAVKKGLVS